MRHRRLRRHGRQIRHRALGAHSGRGRARPRVPLPRPDSDAAHAGGGHLTVRRDDGHADGVAPRPRAGFQGAGHLQYAGRLHSARIRCGAVHARWPGSRRGLHEGVRRTDHRRLRAGPVSGADQGRDVPRRDRADAGFAQGDAPQNPVDPRHADQCHPAGGGPDGRCEVVPVPWPSCRLSGRHGRRAEAQGDRVHLHRRLRRGRIEARADRAGR